MKSKISELFPEIITLILNLGISLCFAFLLFHLKFGLLFAVLSLLWVIHTSILVSFIESISISRELKGVDKR